MIVKVDPLKPEPEAINRACEILLNGSLVAFPTETVYGLGAIATNEDAVKKIFFLKGRPGDNPLIVHICDINQLNYLVTDVPVSALNVMNVLWPGPLSIIMNARESIPLATRGGLESVAIRMPAHPVALALIKGSGPIAAPSANKSGRPSPTTALHVFQDFGEDVLILDGGPTLVGLESTVVDVREDPWKIYRPGAVTKEMLEDYGKVRVVYANKLENPSQPAPSPGMKYRHYAPNVPVMLFREESEVPKDVRITVIALDSLQEVFDKTYVTFIGLGPDKQSAAARIYMALRRAEDFGQITYVQLMDQEGIGIAYNERVTRAAGSPRKLAD
ncbi:L-threonylcarbamoyladenylate synthase [Coprothermobacter platensis]|uniref:L-threonylcarbamoyladenylate synthase n=1 Tax=Coprothermobacter platensis TaxID=108819 RepID=UPI0003624D23|nr:L-threonylcarbamoyladenylate synthase [Coprothermobacter platensis]